MRQGGVPRQVSRNRAHANRKPENLGSGDPDKLAAARAREGQAEVGDEGHIPARAKLGARRANAAVAHFHGSDLQRPSGLRVRYRIRSACARDKASSLPLRLPFEQPVEEITHRGNCHSRRAS